MVRYEALTNEAKMQRVWEDEQAFRALDPKPGPARSDKSYVLEMWPFPSGTLHMGHPLVYTIGDILSRFRRRNGKNVLHVMGFDSFGLPAENAAIREGEHPRKIVERNIMGITATMRQMGWGYDWSRLVSAHEPEYYRSTQWHFPELF